METNITPVTLAARHVESAKLLADRRHILPLLRKGAVFVEVGVATGDFSELVLAQTAPREFIGIDNFQMHTWGTMWGRPPNEFFQGRTHEEQYRQRFANESGVRVLSGDSRDMLESLPDHSADYIYIDAWHKYENVKEELEQAKRILRADGMIMLNDYIMFDHLVGDHYGVIQAANEFIVEHDWEIAYFALHPLMFCDIAIRPRTPQAV